MIEEVKPWNGADFDQTRIGHIQRELFRASQEP
jgi:hypothetical protein